MAAAAAPPAPSPPALPPAGPCCPGSWPNFAVVCSFLERYGALLDLPELPFPELERVLQPPQEPGDQGERPGCLSPSPPLPLSPYGRPGGPRCGGRRGGPGLFPPRLLPAPGVERAGGEEGPGIPGAALRGEGNPLPPQHDPFFFRRGEQLLVCLGVPGGSCLPPQWSTGRRWGTSPSLPPSPHLGAGRDPPPIPPPPRFSGSVPELCVPAEWRLSCSNLFLFRLVLAAGLFHLPSSPPQLEGCFAVPPSPFMHVSVFTSPLKKGGTHTRQYADTLSAPSFPRCVCGVRKGGGTEALSSLHGCCCRPSPPHRHSQPLCAISIPLFFSPWSSLVVGAGV